MKSINVVAAIILNPNQDQVLLAKRPVDKHKGGLWEFPGGKVEANESNHSALIREIKEELDINIHIDSEFKFISHAYPEKTVNLHFYLAKVDDGIPKGNEGQQVEWVKMNQIETYEFPEANDAVVQELVKKFNV